MMSASASCAERDSARTGTDCSTTTSSVGSGWPSRPLAAGRDGFIVAPDVDVPGRRDAQLDLMADLLAAHLDIDAVLGLLDSGAPQRPTVTTQLAR